jgi:hypothetical protein
MSLLDLYAAAQGVVGRCRQLEWRRCNLYGSRGGGTWGCRIRNANYLVVECLACCHSLPPVGVVFNFSWRPPRNPTTSGGIRWKFLSSPSIPLPRLIATTSHALLHPWDTDEGSCSYYRCGCFSRRPSRGWRTRCSLSLARSMLKIQIWLPSTLSRTTSMLCPLVMLWMSLTIMASTLTNMSHPIFLPTASKLGCQHRVHLHRMKSEITYPCKVSHYQICSVSSKIPKFQVLLSTIAKLFCDLQKRNCM